MNLKFLFLGAGDGKLIWYILQIAKAHFKYPQGLYRPVCLHCGAPITKCPLQQSIAYKKMYNKFYNSFSPGLVVFIDMSLHILTEGRNFKTFFKESYVAVWDSCYLITKL